jgi:hypothetical protein
MTEALTGTPWLAVLSRIIKFSDDETTRTLAGMLYDILACTTSREIDEIVDSYARRLIGSLV